MRRFADPTRCPSCSTPLTAGSLTCSACHLDLSGPLGHELFTTLQRADTIVDTIRQRTRTATDPGQPARQQPIAPPARRRPVRAASVPAILLGLGAVCLLVAALVFLAVTWSRMGVGGRTASLVVLTLTVGLLTAWSAHRGLRGATEALGLVTLGLAVLDLMGADSSGWLGDPSAAMMTTIVGAFLVAAGLAATTTLARTAAAGFVVGELAVALGALLVSGGVSAQAWSTPAARLLLTTIAVIALLVGVERLVRTGSSTYRVAGWCLVPVAVLDWTGLVVTGIDAVDLTPTVGSVWGELQAWPLVAAFAVAILAAAPTRLPDTLRVLVASIGLVPLGLALLAPAWDEPTTTLVLAVVALSAALVVLMTAAPAPWGASGLVPAFLCAGVVGLEAVQHLGGAIERYAATAAAAWAGTPGGRIVEVAGPDLDARWLLPVCVATLAALLWAAARLLPAGRVLSTDVLLRAGLAVIAVTGVATLLLHPVPVWTVLVAGLAASVAVGWPALRGDDRSAAVLGAVVLIGTVGLSWYDEQLSASTLVAALALVLVVHLRTRLEDVAAVAGMLAVASAAGLTWTVAALAGAEAPWRGVSTLVLLAVLVLARHRLPAGIRTGRVHDALELAAVSVSAIATLGAVGSADPADQATWTAVHLTLTGACASALALVRSDRREIGWLGGFLLVAATWVRLEDLGVQQPEPYTLPTALALLVLGLIRLRRTPPAGTLSTLGAGLGLALAPSLLWVLEAPTGLRALLLGLACLGLVVAGVQLRWAAPVLYGGVVGLVLVLREAAPYLGDTVPRWALIGAAGAVLIALGVTWEQRLKDARLVSSYLQGLR